MEKFQGENDNPISMLFDYSLISLWTIIWFLTVRLYSLRSYSITGAYNQYGFGVAIATFAYKIEALILVIFFVVSFIRGEWLLPFITTIIALVTSAIISKILVTMKIIVPDTTKINSRIISTYGILTILSQIILVIYLILIN